MHITIVVYTTDVVKVLGIQMSYETKTRPELCDFEEPNRDKLEVEKRYRQAIAADIQFDLTDLKAELVHLTNAVSFIKESVKIHEMELETAINNGGNKHKELYVILDSDGDIVENFPENSNFDYMFQRKQAVCPYGKLYKATLVLEREEQENIQVNHEKSRSKKRVTEQ